LARQPLWSPDSSFLLVSGTDDKGRQGIYRVDAQTGESAPLVVAAEPGRLPLARGLSPDGKRLYIGRTDANGAVVLARELQSGTEREILRRDVLQGSALSPDGRYLAITAFDMSSRSRTSVKSGSLLVVPVEGGQPHELLRVSAPETLGEFVKWLPDGKSLLFRKGPEEGPGGRATFRIPVEGGTPVKYGAEWTPGPFSIRSDGRQVAFMTGQPKFEIWALENFLPAQAGTNERAKK
jgi:Tol biopolymer transport system component